MIDLSPCLSRNPAKTYILACSSGLDSMVLLHCFKSQGFPFSVAHVNYQLRNEESDADAHFLKQYCEASGIKFHLKSVAFKKQLQVNKGNLQQEARKLRYQFFKELMAEEPQSLVVTAHHLNDQVETFFLHLLRNSGISGLAGMPENNGWLLRPFLSLRKMDLHAYAIENNLSWREDSSNAQWKYARNALRNKVLPDLMDKFPGLEANILYLQGIFMEENHHIQRLAQQTSTRWMNKKTISLESLKGNPNLVVACFKGLDIEPRFIPAILSLFRSENNKGIYFKSNLHGIKGLKKRNDQLEILFHEPNELFRFETTHVSELPITFNLLTWYIEASMVSAPLTLTINHKEEAITPIGLRNPKKINRILKDAGIPEEKRKQWPILRLGDQIIGIPGVCLNKKFAPRMEKALYLRITFFPC